MKIKITIKFAIVFLMLTFFMGELHELVHTSVGRLMCGCWGDRDFNVWGLCEGCWDELFPYSTLSTFAGPIFTFSMWWVGYYLLGKEKSMTQHSLGFALVFANLPFARLLTAGFGGGDEVYALSLLTENYNLSWVIGFVVILLVAFPPLKRAYNSMGDRRKIGWFLLFFLAPTAIYLVVVLLGLNGMLSNGVLNQPGILGSPLMINVWFALVSLILWITWSSVYDLFGSSSKSTKLNKEIETTRKSVV